MKLNWKNWWILGVLFMAGFAIASGEYDDDRSNDDEPVPMASADSFSSSESNPTAIAEGGEASGGAGGTAGAESKSDSSITITEEHPDNITLKNTPSARAPYANSTSPCRVAGSLGLGLPGFGLSGGGSKEDKECTLRQTAQTFSSMGMPAMGLWILCRSKVIDRIGSDSDICDTMVAQFQKEARLVSPGKF